jgi:nucleoside phosphorylase
MSKLNQELQNVTRELQALYVRRDAEQRGIQLHAARLHPIRQQIKDAEARAQVLQMEAAALATAAQL